MLIDARTVDSGFQFECDLCVIGAGPAGIAIADRLRTSGLSVLLLESGGFDYQLATQALYRGEVRGHSYWRLDACRWRLFGGGSNRWGGWCRPLAPLDFTQRAWLAHSGWPIGAETLEPYHADAARLFELPNARFDVAAWRDRVPAPLALDGSEFENLFFQHSPETNLGESRRAALLGAAHVTTMLYANVTRLRLDPGSPTVAALEVATLTGRRFSVRPKAVVLAAGGIENARLLLASNAERPGGLGNEHDLVGRYFMEHLHVPLAHLLLAPGAGTNDFYRKAIFEDVRLRGVISPTAAAQERHQRLATSIAIEDASYAVGTPFVGWPPPIMFAPVRGYRWLQRRRRLAWLAEGAKQFAHGAHSVPGRLRSWRQARAARAQAGARAGHRVYSLYFRAEQAPDPANRVALCEARDALGVPQARLEWRLNPLDTASITGWLEVLDRELRARGLGTVTGPLEDWQSGITGGPHHMGTTRMSANARCGVVDADCRVHSVENLYIAGSSVFATGGCVNPTFALVTLALRLADTLERRLRTK